jgi:hypothetical protein
MASITIQKQDYKKIISVPFTLEQLAFSLNQLSRKDIEMLEELVDGKFRKMVLSRGREIASQYTKGETLSLSELQEEFGK